MPFTERSGARGLVLGAALCLGGPAAADPCGMVPPVLVDGQPPRDIERQGAQRTYVMFKDGVQTVALRPGFVGDVDEFGMLIPFPSPPAIRKIDDATFSHIEGAIQPPTVRARIYEPMEYLRFADAPTGASGAVAESAEEGGLAYNKVRVLKEEAVGMYQVAVLEAGSSRALDIWMTENGYRYPDGMDGPVDDYVAERWCFVAIKARVGAGDQVAPRPGMRTADPSRPAGSQFDGHVQGMGFRFQVDAPVVPMRLSVFNPDASGDGPRNVIYMLTDGPVRVDDIGTQVVARQLSGETLYAHLTEPLDVTWIDGKAEDTTPEELARLEAMRDPTPYVSAARDIFAADLAALAAPGLSLPVEEEQKELLDISERLGLRGPAVDALHQAVLATRRQAAVDAVLRDLRGMTLTVVDGQLPTQVLARQNLTFSPWTLPASDAPPRTDPLTPPDLYIELVRR